MDRVTLPSWLSPALPSRLPVWVAGALALAFLLRIPWFGVALGNDEGGLAYIAGAWHDDGRFPYGDYFIDRPPLLLLLYRFAALTGGTASVRTIGVLAVLALVVVTALLARDVAGDRAAGRAALIAAVLGSSAAIGAVYTPAELLAVLPSALSVLLVWKGVRGATPRLLPLAGAGTLAVCALLVKQSFGDALLAGTVCIAASALVERPGWRAVASSGGAYLGGMLLPIAALEVWELAAAIPGHVGRSGVTSSWWSGGGSAEPPRGSSGHRGPQTRRLTCKSTDEGAPRWPRGRA